MSELFELVVGDGHVLFEAFDSVADSIVDNERNKLETGLRASNKW
jgi:hypothetical protein